MVVYLPRINPCTGARHALRYSSAYCESCCRGPVYDGEVMLAAFFSGIVYVGAWFAGWYLNNCTYAQDKTHTI